MIKIQHMVSIFGGRKWRVTTAWKRVLTKPSKILDFDNITEKFVLTPLRKCVRLSDIKNDVCPKRNYKISETKAEIYSTVGGLLARSMNMLKSYFSSSCVKKYISIYCYLAGGPICSDNEHLFIHIISRQDCRKGLQKCFSSMSIPNDKRNETLRNFRAMCNSLPDNNTKRVILPKGIDANMILTTQEDENGNGENGNGTDTDDGKGVGMKNNVESIMLVIALIYTLIITLK